MRSYVMADAHLFQKCSCNSPTEWYRQAIKQKASRGERWFNFHTKKKNFFRFNFTKKSFYPFLLIYFHQLPGATLT